MDNPNELRCISLCTGYGGLEMGLKRAIPNVRTVAYVEIEAYACANLVAKIEEGRLDCAPIWTDVKTFPARYFRNRVHIITAGYPCQPFSVAGKRKGTDDPRHLWPHIARIVKAVRPILCVFENVPGHLSIGLPEVYCSLRDMGYSVEGILVTAAEVGAPHKRQRLFIMAHKQGYGLEGLTTQGFEQGGITGAYEEVANTKRLGRRGRDNGESTGQGRTLQIKGSGQLADTEHTRQGSRTKQKAQVGIGWDRLTECRWPSRPGQPQYEWEEPRVVSYACNSGWGKLLQQEQECGSGIETDIGSKSKVRMEGQAQSGVGRAVNGPSSRVDRLRLLGNGVVPQCAEKAIRILSEK